jgi:thioredoxin reductase
MAKELVRSERRCHGAPMNNSPSSWDCVIVGGGAAGLSAALVLGRARRRALLVDAGRQSNLAAHGIGGFLGADRRPPADFYAEGRRELADYPTILVADGEATAAAPDGEGFSLGLSDGSTHTARTVLLAGGTEYRYPSLPGIADLWGNSVFHCPFCHGWEVRERALGVLGADAGGVHRALLLRAWSEDVTLLTDGAAELDAGQRAQLADAGVEVDERPLDSLAGEGDALRSVTFSDGSERPLGGLLVAVTLHQRDGLAGLLGVSLAEAGPLSAETVAVDPRFATTTPGVYAAGDLALQMPSVANAVMSGSVAAAAVVGELSGAVPRSTAAAPRR